MNRQESGTLSTFMTGAVVGAGMALLFAPEAGFQIRRPLSEYMARAKDEFDKTIDQGTEKLDSRTAFKQTKDEFSSRHH